MIEMRGENLLAKAKESISLATNYSWNTTQPDGHWIGELLSNVTLTAEHVFFLHSLGQTPIKDANEYQRYLLSEQKPDGGWGIAPDLPSELSTSAEAYLALKILGLPTDAPEMQRARNFVRASGGIAKVRILSRLFFAQFGLFPWDAVPQLPAEFVLMPPQFPLNIYKLASWARSNVVPLLIICHHRPIYPLPNGRLENNTYLDELWLDPSNKMIPYGPSLLQPLKTDPVAYIFNIVDKALYYLNGLRGCPVRGYARRKCIDWILERQEEAGDWAGIAPPMHSGIKALLLEGFTLNDKPVIMGMEALERFMWRDKNGKRLQACISPVWDTCLMTRALCDAEVDRGDVRLCRAVEWTKARQILGPQGDWRIYNPHLLPGGFAFEYHNTWYPDVDDTAAVVLGFLRHDLKAAASFSVIRAVTWILGMQNSDGGWGAFDHENDALYLNKIPFSDMNSLCDPSTPDVTGRILEAFGLMRKAAQKVLIPVDLMNRIHSSCDRAIPFITQTQVPWGPWYGRWGSNYIYGTSNVLCGLSYYINEYPNVLCMIQNATNWLKKVQNNDGGWGESLHTYTETWRAGNGPSTPSQTGWALMGLLNICSPDDESVISGVSYLVRTQTDFLGDGASWPEKEYTGTGFPNHFYIGYTLYRHYFPLMAMGRFISLASSRSEKKETTNGLT